MIPVSLEGFLPLPPRGPCEKALLRTPAIVGARWQMSFEQDAIWDLAREISERDMQWPPALDGDAVVEAGAAKLPAVGFGMYNTKAEMKRDN